MFVSNISVRIQLDAGVAAVCRTLPEAGVTRTRRLRCSHSSVAFKTLQAVDWRVLLSVERIGLL